MILDVPRETHLVSSLVLRAAICLSRRFCSPSALGSLAFFA